MPFPSVDHQLHQDTLQEHTGQGRTRDVALAPFYTSGVQYGKFRGQREVKLPFPRTRHSPLLSLRAKSHWKAFRRLGDIDRANVEHAEYLSLLCHYFDTTAATDLCHHRHLLPRSCLRPAFPVHAATCVRFWQLTLMLHPALPHLHKRVKLVLLVAKRMRTSHRAVKQSFLAWYALSP